MRFTSIARRPSPQPSPGHTGRGSQTAITVLLLSSLVHAAATPTAPPSPQAIDAAMDRGKAFLYSIQSPDGTWETEPQPKDKPKDSHGYYDDAQWGNRTALAVYTLLELGERATEPKLQKAIAFLQNEQITSTYVLSLKCMVWSNLPQSPEVKKALRRDAAMLITLKKTVNQNYIAWDYAADKDRNKPYNYSLINTEDTAYGLAAAADADYEVPADLWKAMDRTFTATQTAAGGWRDRFEKDYGKSSNITSKPLRMFDTAGGAAALQIAQDFSRTDATPKGNSSSPALDKATEWISKNFTQPPSTETGVAPENMNRRLYGIAQFALATGLRRFGDHDWYGESSTYFIEKQNKKTGYWGYTPKSGSIDYRLVDTCWALLALERGQVPVAIAKLDYSSGSDDPKKATWNQRSRDVANLVRWISRATERELRWQIVTTNDSPDALLESPVLYMAGGDAVSLKPEAKEKLKTYLENGGLIFAAADAASPAFSKSIERLGLELFPGNEWRDIPDTHPIFSDQVYKRGVFKSRPLIRGLSNGVRELIVLVPAGDPAKTWQLRSGKNNPDVWQLAADVVSYAVDKTHYYARGTSWLLPENKTTKPKTAITVGRLKYAGAWDPEPAAFTQFARFAQVRDVGVITKTIDAGTPIDGVDVLYVTGAAAFTFDEPTRTAVKTYLDNGGHVIFEAAGGSEAFAASAQAELTHWYGADALVQLPASHAIYGAKLPVAFRGFNIGSIDKPNEPQLRGIEKDGKVIAVLSRQDLSAGLLGVPTDGITGYTPESSRVLLLRILSNWK